MIDDYLCKQITIDDQDNQNDLQSRVDQVLAPSEDVEISNKVKQSNCALISLIKNWKFNELST